MTYKEARLYRFSKQSEKKLACFKSEISEPDRQLAKDHAQAIHRVERRGKREIIAMVGNRASQFEVEYARLKEAQGFVGDFRECQGSVGTLRITQNADYSFSLS